MINTWLKEDNVDSTSYSFPKYEVLEINEPSEAIINYFSREIINHYRNLRFLKRKFKGEPPEKLVEYLNSYVLADIREEEASSGEINIRKNVRQGDFGEILAVELITKMKKMHVPLFKLRWKFNSNRSIFCTDVFAHNLGDDIQDLKYYEVKTRTSVKKEKIKVNGNEVNHHIGTVAHYGLLKDENSKNSEGIADFLSRYYFELAEEYDEKGDTANAEAYYAYSDKYSEIVKNPSKYNRKFEIILIIEKSKYDPVILDELHQLPPQLEPLEVTLVLINNVKEVVQKFYDKCVQTILAEVYGDEYAKGTVL